jgi:hypothetical protein
MVYERGKVVTVDFGLVMVRGCQTTSYKLCRWEFMVLHVTQFMYSMFNTCPAKCNKIFCSACSAISDQLWTCNLSEEELDYYLQTSFVCLQAAVFKLFDLNFAPTSILQVLHLLPHVQQGTPTKFVRVGSWMSCQSHLVT